MESVKKDEAEILDDLSDNKRRFRQNGSTVCTSAMRRKVFRQMRMHLHIRRGKGRLYPGDGCINIREIANVAEWPVYGIEIPNNRKWEHLGIKEHAARALECTKKYMGEKL